MELIIHDLDDEKLENLKWKIEKKEKITDKINESKCAGDCHTPLTPKNEAFISSIG